MALRYVNSEALKKVAKRGSLTLLTVALCFTLSGCMDIESEKSMNSSVKYDVIDTMDEELVTSGIEQIVDVPGEDFKLKVNYRCLLDNNERWTVTSDKEMYMDICTEGLDPNTHVFIDNVHIDTTIRSYYPSVDGVTQDTMDDRIHNAQMIGFPISDTNTYSNINCIEGQNQTFITGSYHGFNGYSGGSISQKRYVESNYLKAGVFANKISSVIDLIIQKPNGVVTCVSVPSVVGVSVWPYIEVVNEKGESTYRYYYFDENKNEMATKDLTPEEYEQIVSKGKAAHR